MVTRYISLVKFHRIFPPRNITILLLAVLSVNPLITLYITTHPPDGKVFVAQYSEAYQLTLLRSADFGFQDPWGEGWSVFHRPTATSAYIYVPLGVLPTLLGIPTWQYFIFLKILVEFILLVTVYNFCRRFAGKHYNTAFILFLIAGSLGWIFYFSAYMLYGQQAASVVSYALTAEFNEYVGGATSFSHLTQIYWALPEITMLVSIMAYSIKKRLLASVALGLTFLFYPTWGVATAAAIVVYGLIESFDRNPKRLIANAAKGLWMPLACLVLFSLPWVVTYLQIPENFSMYTNNYASQPPLTILMSSLILGGLAIYERSRNRSSVLRKPYFLAVFCLFALLLSGAYIYEKAVVGNSSLLTSTLQNSGLFNLFSALFDYAGILFVPFAAVLFYAAIRVILAKNSAPEKFVTLWILAVLAITTIPASHVFWWPARLQWFLLLPLAVEAAPAVGRLASKKLPLIGTSKARIYIIIFILSLPTLAGFNTRILNLAYEDPSVYISQDDMKAMEFLGDQQAGRVMASWQTAYNTPYLSGQKATVDDLQVYAEERETFFANPADTEARKNIIEKRNITYVFYGTNERQTYGEFQAAGLELIYDKKTKVYKVVDRI